MAWGTGRTAGLQGDCQPGIQRPLRTAERTKRIFHRPLPATGTVRVWRGRASYSASMLLQLFFSCSILQLSGQGSGTDWLVGTHRTSSLVFVDPTAHRITLENGLVARRFLTVPNAATVGLDNAMSGQAELRSVRPEARVTIDGREYDVGGLLGQPIHNYLLPQWLESMSADPAAFRFVGQRSNAIRPRMEWKRRSAWLSAPADWPPKGQELILSFHAPADGPKGVSVDVHYEIYDGLPLISKWIEVANDGPTTITLERFCSEILATVEPASMVGGTSADFAGFQRSIHVESEYSMGGGMDAGIDAPGTRWTLDPLYATQVNYQRQTPCLLEVSPRSGPEAKIAPGARFASYRVFELFHDSSDRERRGLALRRMYRTIAPWATENPLIFHVRSADPAAVRMAIDQAAEVGFELVLMTFGSGFEIEREDSAYLAQMKELGDYAHERGIALGGYSLLASRSIDAANDVINPVTGKPGGFAAFGNSPCLGSEWGQDYFRKLYAFFERTGLDVLEHDGSYPGDQCASSAHPGHATLADSQYSQWRTITNFYAWCRGRGIYLNVPDWYYLSGSNKCGMGYRETNWSLPREQQEIVERQNIYDGTWTKTPSMGWMFVPLTEYQGGGAAATIEPLSEHLDHYRVRLENLLGAGVQACYRGPRLYDSEATRQLVREQVAWFKEHRAILESDIVHGRRPDGCDIDWILHVNPTLKERGMLVAYNPLPLAQQRMLRVDLRYTGISVAASAVFADGSERSIAVDANGRAVIELQVPARGMSWVVLR